MCFPFFYHILSFQHPKDHPQHQARPPLHNPSHNSTHNQCLMETCRMDTSQLPTQQHPQQEDTPHSQAWHPQLDIHLQVTHLQDTPLLIQPIQLIHPQHIQRLLQVLVSLPLHHQQQVRYCLLVFWQKQTSGINIKFFCKVNRGVRVPLFS